MAVLVRGAWALPCFPRTATYCCPHPLNSGVYCLYQPMKQVLWPLVLTRVWVHSRRERSSSSYSFWR